MGCVQAKPSTQSPPRGLEKMKLDHGYVPSSDYGVPARRQLHNRTQVAAEGGEDGNVLTKEGEREGFGVSRRVLQPPPVAGGAGNFLTKEGETAGFGVSRRVLQPSASEVGGGEAGKVVDGWPRWLTDNIPKQALAGLEPKSADSYEMIDKVGQGTYSNVYKARDRDTGKIVALKKVRFDTSESESVRFMAREIMILQKLDHPNVIKLEGLATSRMQYSIYLVFDFMQTDLTRVISRPDTKLTEPQVKCYMQQLLSGLQHCHERGILHRDIKGANLLIDKDGTLKIADFGLANYFNPNLKRPLTSRVVTLWYRAPELLLGTTDYGVGIDLWSAGCLLGEMFAGRPIMPGRTEVEQLHRIFKLCGSPSEDYWRKLNLSTSFRSPQPYKPSILETFRNFTSSSLSLLMILLALDPSYRGSAASALQNDFFSTSPLACDLSGLPIIYKEEIDESNRPRERKKRKKLKQRSQTQKEGQRKIEQTTLKAKGDSGSSKEEKAAELGIRSPEFGSSAGSTSSGVKPQGSSMSPTPSQSPDAFTLIERSRRSESHTFVPRNIKNLPPIPASGRDDAVGKGGGVIENAHRYSLGKRSASASGFRRFLENQVP